MVVAALLLVVGSCRQPDDAGPAVTPPTNEPSTSAPDSTSSPTTERDGTVVGAAVLARQRFALLDGRRVGVILNQASTVDGAPLLDLLAAAPEVELVAAFAPEHGLRGDRPAGSAVEDEVDPATGVPVYSLYGSTRSPPAEVLAGLDVLVFDLQDVGARFYTYISTLGLAMQAAAEAGVSFVVLDRPNPLGGRSVEGHRRQPDQDSFVGLYPIPVTHGMTVGELAGAIVGEGWLPGLDGLDLQVVTMEGWQRSQRWPDLDLPWTAPSPSLPTPTSAAVYPGTVLFEATSLSVGRGTTEPFTTVGAPFLDPHRLADDLNARSLAGVRFEPSTFTPRASAAVPDPPFEGETVHGVRIVVVDISAFAPVAAGLHVLDAVQAEAAAQGVGEVISSPQLFDLLAGTDQLRIGLEAGEDPSTLIEAWAGDVAAFTERRQPYLLYP